MAHGRYILARMGPRPRRRVDEFSLSGIEGVGDALLVTDTRLGVIAWNKAMERLTGVARADALGRTAQAVLPFLAEAALTTHLRRALAGHAVSTDEFPYALPSLAARAGCGSAMFPGGTRPGPSPVSSGSWWTSPTGGAACSFARRSKRSASRSHPRSTSTRCSTRSSGRRSR